MGLFVRVESAGRPLSDEESWSFPWGTADLILEHGGKNATLLAGYELAEELGVDLDDCTDSEIEDATSSIREERLLLAVRAARRGLSCFDNVEALDRYMEARCLRLNQLSEANSELVVFRGEFRGVGEDGEDLAVFTADVWRGTDIDAAIAALSE